MTAWLRCRQGKAAGARASPTTSTANLAESRLPVNKVVEFQNYQRKLVNITAGPWEALISLCNFFFSLKHSFKRKGENHFALKCRDVGGDCLGFFFI